MEYFLRIILLTVKFISILISPIRYCLRARNPLTANLPPITNSLLTLSAKELRRLLIARQLKSVELVSAYIERIVHVNPVLNALSDSCFANALLEATRIDGIIATTDDLEQLFQQRPLLGLPMSIKESCRVEGLAYSVGSKSRRGLQAGEDGDVVHKLREAGAVCLLVSSTPEFCYSITTDTQLNGYVRNPYDFSRSAGGSSGGEGALNGAGATLFGLGSDIGGSIRIPSLFCGVFGHKPSGNIVSVEGHFPNSTDPDFAHYLVLGPITRFAEDLADLLEVMAGENAAVLRLREPIHVTQLKVLYSFGFDGLNGWMHQSVDEEIKDSIRKAVAHLKNLGMSVEETSIPGFRNSLEIALSGITSLPNMDYLLSLHPSHQNYRVSKVRETLCELWRSLRGRSDYTTNALIFDLMRRKNGFMPSRRPDFYLEEAKNLIQEMTQLLGENGVLIFPTMHAPAPKNWLTFLQLWGVDYTLLFNALGMPVTHVPMGLGSRSGLPVGFSVIAAPNQDRLCLTMAMEMEKAFGGWCAPTSASRDYY